MVCDEALFLRLCGQLLSQPHPDAGTRTSGVDEAINHAVGWVTEALLHLLVKRKPKERDGLPADMEPLFSRLCDTGVAQFRHGRVILAANLVYLFCVDQAWTEARLLPLLDWSASPDEAVALWQGLLQGGKLHWPLITALKPPLLDTAGQCAALGEYCEPYAAFLTWVALERPAGLTADELAAAIDRLPADGLRAAAQTLVQAGKKAGEQREEYWRSRIEPFWRQVWPKRARTEFAPDRGRLGAIGDRRRGGVSRGD